MQTQGNEGELHGAPSSVASISFISCVWVLKSKFSAFFLSLNTIMPLLQTLFLWVAFFAHAYLFFRIPMSEMFYSNWER